ncbi:aromatic ring-hydroxylating oxygenase subunit alpha [Phenylobacterium immobile]|uniref:aromatic ring-hydroxylating oxygenase subunit alpha n=1 Tax=Phenylobacterium immobile TaxID=21 RepID=UPI000A86BBC8|nr:aromatic ring-hydroxylating dioxygenase subunit alpha [Phenylobacterium immobile]
MLRDSSRPFHDYVDPENGTVDRVIFSDQAIYEMELEQIFARAWNFMCHETQIPKPGDFFLSFIGEESVIATRDKKGELQVLLNSCRHRGNAVCRAEMGNARSFLCTYHGWTYGLDGQLIGVPGYKDFYHEQLDKSQWGLVKAGKVASYKGFVFATMDPEAPDLEEYLGEVGRMGIDLVAERGDQVAIEGVQKNIIGCNWKLAVDNLFDWYHVQISHASAMMSGYNSLRRPPVDKDGNPIAVGPGTADPNAHRVLLGEYGHAISGPRITPAQREQMALMGDNPPPFLDERWRDTPSASAALGEAGRDTRGHPNIFPNLWVASGGTQLSLRLPKGPTGCEIWWFTVIPKDLTDDVRKQRITNANHTFGPAGMLEQDDGENWDQSTRQTMGVVARRYPLNFSMNKGFGQWTEMENGKVIDTHISEHAQLWTYRAWADWMDAANWAELKAQRTLVPAEAV